MYIFISKSFVLIYLTSVIQMKIVRLRKKLYRNHTILCMGVPVELIKLTQ